MKPNAFLRETRRRIARFLKGYLSVKSRREWVAGRPPLKAIR